MHIEDYLELFTGLSNQSTQDNKFTCAEKDEILMNSLGRQVFRQVALTDRQHELAKSKLLEYKEQFIRYGFDNLENDIDSLRMPLRQIDRQKTISLQDRNNKITIAVRFPFSKKMIKHIEFLQRLQTQKNYDNKSKTHFIDFNEYNLFQIIFKLKDCNFEVQKELLEYYRLLKIMKDDKENNAPGIYGFKIKNLHAKAIEYAISSIGEPSPENIIAYKDRENLLGLKYFEDVELQETISNLQPLTKKILKRTTNNVYIDQNQYTFNNLVESILELYRFPVLIVLPREDEYDALVHTYRTFQNIIPDERISVLFRMDNDEEGREFNKFVRTNKLNNTLDKRTKIVYISSNKIPKPLIASDWYPELGIVLKGSRVMKNIQTYLDNIDLVMHYDDVHLPWGGNTTKIEKI
tara:strand:- start:345 stop:1565 length:1221 start_codon:yes stop_codon:yes gene_type:complete